MRADDLKAAIENMEFEAGEFEAAGEQSNGQADAVTVAEALLLCARTAKRLRRLGNRLRPGKGKG
jgi:hypothetical protein